MFTPELLAACVTAPLVPPDRRAMVTRVGSPAGAAHISSTSSPAAVADIIWRFSRLSKNLRDIAGAPFQGFMLVRGHTLPLNGETARPRGHHRNGAVLRRLARP